MDSREQTADFDKREWQAAQVAQAAEDAARQARREKWEKARLRSARRARRKLEKLKSALEQSGELTDWEDEFAASVSGRLDEYGTAFHDPEKGRPSEALSFAQKKVVAALAKKARSSGARPALAPINECEEAAGPAPSAQASEISDENAEETAAQKRSPKPFLRLVK